MWIVLQNYASRKTNAREKRGHVPNCRPEQHMYTWRIGVIAPPPPPHFSHLPCTFSPLPDWRIFAYRCQIRRRLRSGADLRAKPCCFGGKTLRCAGRTAIAGVSESYHSRVSPAQGPFSSHERLGKTTLDDDQVCIHNCRFARALLCFTSPFIHWIHTVFSSFVFTSRAQVAR